MSIVPLLLAVLASSPSPSDEVVARVGDVTITRSAIARRLDFAVRVRTPLESPAEAVESLVNDALLAQDARRLRLGEGARERAQIDAFVEQELRKTAVASVVESFAARRAPDEAVLKEMFHATADFAAYEFLAFASKEDALAARKRIEAGAKFADEAPKAVTSQIFPKSAEAPLTMRAAAGNLTSVFDAPPGALVGPVESDTGGWLLARVLRKQIGTAAEYAERRPALVISLRRKILEAGREHLLQQLRAKQAVKLDEAFLNGLKGRHPSAQELQHVVATIAGTPIRYADVYPKVASLGGQTSHLASGAVRIQLARQLIDERLLESFAAERGLVKLPEVVAARPELERNALGALAVRHIQEGVKPPTKDDVERHYAANRGRYGAPLADVRRAVEAEVFSNRRHDAVHARLVELRAKASISVDQAALARAGE